MHIKFKFYKLSNSEFPEEKLYPPEITKTPNMRKKPVLSKPQNIPRKFTICKHVPEDLLYDMYDLLTTVVQLLTSLCMAFYLPRNSHVQTCFSFLTLRTCMDCHTCEIYVLFTCVTYFTLTRAVV
jgi:hypothetical protein